MSVGSPKPSDGLVWCGILPDVSDPGEEVDNTVVVWHPLWLRVWVPIIGAAVSFVGGVLQVSEGRVPWQFFTLAAFVVLFYNFRAPLLLADSSGSRAGRQPLVPWSEVEKLCCQPDVGRRCPEILKLRDGTLRPLSRDLSPDDVRRLETSWWLHAVKARPRSEGCG